MPKRWRILVEEFIDTNATVNGQVRSYIPVYEQYVNSLDLEELILWVNRLEATKKAPS